nr:2285_t:CDS:2 [Entrophospora candida]
MFWTPDFKIKAYFNQLQMRLKPHLYIKDGQINSLNFKIMQDIPVTVTHEWINFKKPEPKITEFFELMFPLDKEYQKNDSSQRR